MKIAWLALGTLALCSGQTPDSLARDSLARIEGQVVSVTGAPLPGVSVELRVVDLGFVVWETATTDAKGQFVFDAVEPRAYRISAAPSGYVSTERNDTSSSVTVQRGEKRTGIVLRLIRASSITGRVVDQDRNPIPNPKVSLYRKARLTSHNELRLASPFVTSAADGTFTFADVTPGSYYLGIEKDKITSYYPGVFDPSEAIPVTAIAGSDSGGIEIRLPNPQVFHVRGQVIDQETKAPVNAFVQLSSNATVLNRFAPPASTQAKDGNFQLDVLPGSYTVNAAQTPVPGMPPHVGSEMINVGRSDVDDVIVQLHPAPSVTGKITLENGRPADGVRQVRLFSVDDLQDQYLPLMIRGRLDVGKDGSFSLAGLSSGSFYVQINGCPADCMRGISPTGYYLKSIRFNGQDVTNKPLFLPAAGSSTLEIVVAPGAAEASGTVRDADNRPLPNTRVTLWSDSVHITDLTSNDGSFDFRDLAPGEYHILAWEQIEPGLDAIPAFRDKFSAKATTFKVDVSGQAHYDISPVGSDAIQAEAAKLP